ncbi:MAG: hypothetical protein V3T21_04895 [Candidatus Margulisiibacteriota bacterium]
MSDLSIQGFYRRYDTNHDGNISSNEINSNNAAFTKAFLGANRQVQLALLCRMSEKDKLVLFRSIQEHARSAGDSESQKSCLKATSIVGASIAANMRPINNFQDLALNTLMFMHNNIKYVGNVINPKSRDAAEWSGARVLAEGNYNGCVEAVKLFIELYKEAALQKGFTAVACAYTSSFNLSWATPENLASGQTPSGHAMVELKQAGRVLLINAAMFEHPVLSNNRQDQSSNFLAEHAFIVKVDESGKYFMDIDGHPEQYQLFGRGIVPIGQENPNNLFDPTTSNGATRLAVKKYLETKK